MIRIIPAESHEPIFKNPGKGFVIYGEPDISDLTEITPEELSLGSVLYHRWMWSDMEPGENTFCFEKLERDIDFALKHGMKYAFGILNASFDFCPEDGYAVPKWVFDAGARYYEVTDSRGVINRIPYWENNPIFLDKHNEFLKKLAKRYDGDPRVAFIDVRNYGNWGENHIGLINKSDGGEDIPEISADTLETYYYAPYLSYFKKTQLIIPFGQRAHQEAYERAVAQGVGMRRDGIPDWDDGGDIAFVGGRAPTITEYTATLKELVGNNVWDDENVYAAILKANASYTEISRGTGRRGQLNFIREKRALMERLCNRIGYHFVLRLLEIETDSSELTAGTDIPIRMTWENKGVAPLFGESCYPAMALIDGAGEVVEICLLPDMDVHSLKPGITEIQSTLHFGENGIYNLAVGMLLSENDMIPAYRLGMADERNGWYTLCEINYG